MKLGRPSEKPSPVIINEIINWIAHGNTLRSYCRQENKPIGELFIIGWRKMMETLSHASHTHEIWVLMLLQKNVWR